MSFRLGLGLALHMLLIGCGSADQDAADLAERVQSRGFAIRPTDGTGANNNGFGIPAQVYDPPGNHFRVYYVTTSENAVDLKDESPKDGVPDFVQEVGAAAEATYQSSVVKRGFRPPLDDSIYHDRPDYGGDGRFDIYLRWAGKGSDGYRVTEVCTDGSDGTPKDRCAGYFVMNPSYKDSNYPSERDGIMVLTSHELFHTLQDAYNVGQWRTWTEGTAVWNELQVFPDALGTWRDYQGFLPALFREPERPFDKSMGAGGAAAYAYATAAWAEFLSERFGASIIREIWEGCEAPPTGEARHFLDATEDVLKQKYSSSLEAAWTEFTRWNLLTAERAASHIGYLRAEEYPPVRLEPELTAIDQSATVEVNGLSARYLRLRPTLDQPTAVRVTVTDAAGMMPVVGAFITPKGGDKPKNLIEVGAQKDVMLEPGESLFLVVSGAVRGARARNVSVSFSVPVAPPMPMMDDQQNGGCSIGYYSAPSSSTAFYTLLLSSALFFLPLRLRRRIRRSCARAA